MLFPLAMYAQEDYKPFLKDGRTWIHQFANVMRWYIRSLTIQGDTLIEGITWKKVYYEGQYEKALREEYQKVYEQAKDNLTGSQRLLFDFGIQVGERHYLSQYEGDERYLELTGIDHIQSQGIDYRRLKLRQVVGFGGVLDSSDDDYCYWIEGIGSDCGIESTCRWPDVTGYTCQLQSCYDDEECIFSNLDLITGVTEQRHTNRQAAVASTCRVAVSIAATRRASA